MSVPLRTAAVVPGPLVSTRLGASTVNAVKASPWTTQAWSVRVRTTQRPSRSVCRSSLTQRPFRFQYHDILSAIKSRHFHLPQMWTSAAATIAVSTAVRTWWEVSAAAVLRATCSTTSGTNAWVSDTLFCSCSQWWTTQKVPVQCSKEDPGDPFQWKYFKVATS